MPVVTENHVQSVESRDDGTTSLKRQKTPSEEEAKKPTANTSKSRRSRSNETRRYKSGRGFLNIEKCKDEGEARKMIEDFWSPPELGFTQKKSAQGPTPHLASPLQEGDTRESPNRRYSDSASPGALYSSTRPFRTSTRDLPQKRSAIRTLRASESLGYKKGEEGAIGHLVDGLEDLLFGEDENEENKQLQPSGWKKAQRAAEALAREKREREAAERAEKEKREAVRKAAKERRLHRQQPLKPLVQPLNQKWEEIVHKAQYASNPSQVITNSVEGTELRIKDFSTLLGNRSWLNDEIINSYIEWIVDAANKAAIVEAKAQGEPPGTVPKFIAHNSFFFQNLAKKGPSSVDRLMRRKKAPGMSLMEADSVLIPINSGSHWTIGVVRPVAKTIEYFDSMGGNNYKFIDLMRSWLKHQLGASYVEEDWKVPRTGCARQYNGYDCGVFVCTNAFCVAMGLDTSCYDESDMTLQRRNIAAVLINKGFTGDVAWGNGGLLP